MSITKINISTTRKFTLQLFLIAAILIGGLGLMAGTALADAPAPLQTIRFSHDSRVSNYPFQLNLTKLVGGSIHYTANGSLPSPYAPIYSGPIPINKNTVIRAQVFDGAGKPVGDIYTKSYLIIPYAQTIPIISIVGDWGGLNSLNDNANHRGTEWERPMNMEYFTPNGQVAFNVKAGIRIHGGVSRLWSAKKSYRIYFREIYGGPGKLNYPLFKDSPVIEFDKLILRAGFNDSFNYRDAGGAPTAETFSGKYIGDQAARNLHASMGQPIAHGDWVLLYLNGEFWGLYNLTERLMEIDRWAPELGVSAALWEGNIVNSLKFVDEREDVILHHLDELRYQTFTQCR